jgi:hypothetical protein
VDDSLTIKLLRIVKGLGSMVLGKIPRTAVVKCQKKIKAAIERTDMA